jgi:hypothetical protein
LSLSNEAIESYIKKLEKEAKALKEETLRLSWFMRGALSYNEASQLSAIDRELINKIIKENMETTKKSGLPFF